jgi:hypothetical protein
MDDFVDLRDKGVFGVWEGWYESLKGFEDLMIRANEFKGRKET